MSCFLKWVFQLIKMRYVNVLQLADYSCFFCSFFVDRRLETKEIHVKTSKKGFDHYMQLLTNYCHRFQIGWHIHFKLSSVNIFIFFCSSLYPPRYLFYCALSLSLACSVHCCCTKLLHIDINMLSCFFSVLIYFSPILN